MKLPTIEPLEARIAPAVLTISAVDSSKLEGNITGSFTEFQFKVTLDTAEAQPVTVVATAQDGTAKVADGDFNPFSQTLTIPAGTTEFFFTVPIKQDQAIEAEETFSVLLSSPSANASIGTGTATATILNDDFPKISISAVNSSLLEGSATGGTTEFSFEVKLDVASEADVTVLVKTKDGSATVADGDYNAVEQLVTIPAGELSAVVTVPVRHDLRDEGNETFIVELSDPSSNAVIGTGSATVTVLDDDPPSISIGDAGDVLEGAAGETKQMKFTVTLQGPADAPITFDYAITGGTAAAGSDFAVITGQATIPAGQSSFDFFVNINGDDLGEADETVFATISNARLGGQVLTITDNNAVGVIKNDDRSVTLSGPGSIVEGNLVTGGPSTTSANYTITLSEPSNHPVLVELEIVNGTAKAGSDFTVPSLFVTIPGNGTATTANFVLPITIDNAFEEDETFEVRIKAVTNAVAGEQDSVTTTIVNDDAKPALKVVSRTIVEGNGAVEGVGGTKQVQITVSLSAPAGEDVTFNWATVDGTAVAGLDYESVVDGEATIPAGAQSVTLNVTVLGDSIYEADETFSIAISDLSSNAVLDTDPANGTITIENDEVLPALSIADTSVVEGPGAKLAFVVSLPEGLTADQPITFQWQAGFGTATSGVDYTPVQSTATINPGETSVTIFVDVLDDAINEPNETVFVTIAGATLGSGPGAKDLPLADSQAVGTIINDERRLSISAPTTIVEGDAGTSVANYVVTLTNALGQPTANNVPVTVTVRVNTGASTAVQGEDFAFFSVPTGDEEPTQLTELTLTIPAGQTSVSFDVTIFGDTKFEGDEAIVLEMVNPVNAAVENQAVSTLVNDDAAPKLIVENAAVAEGNGGVTLMKFIVRLTNPTTEDVTFDWSTADGTAAFGQDYSRVLSGTGTILAGESQAEITVAISGDTTVEPDETFFVNVTNAIQGGDTPVAIEDAQAVGTIRNDEVQVQIAPGTRSEGNAGQANMNFVVSASQVSAYDVTVTFEVLEGTAKEGEDYALPGQFQVVIPAGLLAATIQIPIIGDTIFETNETFTVKLVDAANAAVAPTGGSATGTIVNDDTAPAISIDHVSVVEGNAGTKVVEFTVSMNAASDLPVTVRATPISGSAVSGSDFTATAQTITFEPGETEAKFRVTINGDTVFEPDETFTVALSNPTNATIAAGTGTGTILGDDAEPTISIKAPAPKSEGTGGNQTFTYEVELSNASSVPVTVTASTLDGTALAGSDYLARTQTLTIPAGQTKASFSVTVLADAIAEATEHFSVQLSNASGAAITTDLAVGTIVNDDLAALSIADKTIVEGNSGEQEVRVTVTLSTAADRDVTFQWNVANGGTATLGTDYTIESQGQTITIPAGQRTADIVFKVLGDTEIEADESFTVQLSNATFSDNAPVAFSKGSAEVKFLNDELSLSVGDATVAEGDTGEVDMEFTITLSGESTHAVTVYYYTQDLTATSLGDTADYVGIPAPGIPVTFAPGETSKTVSVTVKGDVNSDGDDQFKLILSQPANALIGDGEAIGTITDGNDALPTISIGGDIELAENADKVTVNGVETDAPKTLFKFAVTLDHASDEEVEVFVTTVNGTAQAGTDFVGLTKHRVVFAPGETSKEVVVEVLNDDLYETAEAFTVLLSDPSGGLLAEDAEATGTIKADPTEPAPTLQVTSQSIVEGDNGQKFLTFVVQRIGATGSAITFDFKTVAHTGPAAATPGVDFVPVDLSDLTLAANETSRTFQVEILTDTVDELDETFSVEVVATSGASPAPVTATGTILNDDVLVTLEQGTYSILEGNSGDSDLVFIVKLSEASTHDIVVTYTVGGGTAQPGADYRVPEVLSLLIPNGSDTGEIRIPVRGDTVAEPAETFVVTLTGATHAELGTTDLSATGTIVNDDATLTIGDSQIIEGANGTKLMRFTVTLEAAANLPVSVNYTTQGVTATSGTDFEAVSGTLQFPVGETEAFIDVPIKGDITPEQNETFNVVLSNASGATVVRNSATGTILNDDTALSISDVTITEGDSGTKTAVFTVTRSAASGFDVSVRVSTVDGTAVSDGEIPDFIEKTQVLTFSGNQLTQTFSVVILGDTAFEPGTEQFQVVLSEATNAVVLKGEGTGTITNGADAPPTIRIDDASITEGNDGTKQLGFVVTLSEATGFDVSFRLNTALSGATNAAGATDFTGVDQVFTIPAGTKSYTVYVPVLGDTVDELDEVFIANLSEANIGGTLNLAIGKGQAIGTILNDELTVSIAPTASGSESAGPIPVKITLSTVSTHNVIVSFKLENGSAVLGTDYTAPGSFTVTIPAGQTEAFVNVPITDDAVDENDKTFKVTLTGATNAVLGDTTSSNVTIVDDDLEPVVSVEDVSVVEGQNAIFTVKLGTASAKDVTIYWVTEAGTATTSDYQHSANARTLVIPAGQLTGQISIPTTNDNVDELAETFQLRILSSLENPAGNPGVTATATIEANDENRISISDARVVETDGQTQMVFTVTRTGSNLPVSVQYGTQNGTAIAGVDYLGVQNQLLEFASGESSKTISITIVGDNDVELDETFFVTLSSPTNASIQTGSGRGTIADDEVQYSIQTENSFSIVEGDGPGTKVLQLRIQRVVEGTTAAPNFAGTVFYETAVNTAEGALRATAGTDFITKSGSVTFAPGETFKIIEIAIVGDNILEGDETFAVKLTNGVNGAPSATEGERVITILDNDRLNNPSAPKVIIEDGQLVEGAAGQTTDMVFKVKLVGADGSTPATAAGAVEVTYSLADLTAEAGGDYTGLPGATATITIASGQSEGVIRVPIVGDHDAAEPDETFEVNLVGAKFLTPGSGDAVALQIADSQAIGTILNDDLTITLDPYEPFAEGSGDQTLNFTVRIPQAVGYDVKLRVKTVDGTAVSSGAEADYVRIDQEIIIPAGQTEFTFSVTVKGDPFAEGNETFNLVFSEVKNAAFDTAPRTVTLLNDDAAPTLSIGDATVVEGDDGQQNMVFNVVLSGANREQITVDFATVDGTAKSSGALLDYLARNGTIVFDPSTEGSVTKTISVPILGDTWKEQTENFTVALSNARSGGETTGVTISDGTGTGEIVDDGDTTLGVILHNAQVVEGAAGANSSLRFTLETTAPVTGSDINLLANTRAGTAKVGEDFNALANANVTIAVGQTTGTVTVTVRGDNDFEASEFLFLDVTGFGENVEPVNGSGGTVSAYGVVLNDDIKVISAREFQYIDTDGDLVTVKFSKGTLSVPLTGAGGNSNNIFFTFSGTVGGRMIQQINLTSAGFAFEGVNISVTAKPQILVTGDILGDGMANVGSLFAASVNSDLFQVSSGIALGKVSISGNLGQLVAGSTKRPAGVKFLEVGSFGSDSTVGSLVLGPINKMVVHGDFLGNLRVIGDAAAQPIPGGGVGRIGKLVIEGALKGGTNEGSGRITFTGGVGSATIGSILGGSGVNSGTLVPAGDGFNTSIGRLTVLGDMVGGSGEQSGLVQTSRIGSLMFGKIAQGTNAIEGNLIGGAGKFSGLVTAGQIGKVVINGNIEGGTGENSGNILADRSLGTTRLTGSLIGGAGKGAGLINVGVLSGNVTIEGDIEGGAGQNSGALSVNGYRLGFESFLGNAKTITLGKVGAQSGGSLIGGTGASSGRIDVNGNLNKFVAFGDIVGGTGANSGALVVGSTQANTALKTALIKGSILGGSTDAAGTPNGVTSLLGTGYIEADRIGKLTVEGSLVSGANLGTGLAKSGGVYAGTTIGSLKVLGKGGTAVEGSAATPVVITALNRIGNVTFGGDVQYLELLSGYAAPTSTATPRGVMLDAGASIGKVIVIGQLSGSSIVAGAHAGADGKFGTADDTSATNGTNSLPSNQDLVSKIASVVIQEIGVPLDAPVNASFGLVAEHIAKLRIGGALHPLTKGPSNDGLAPIGAPAARMQIFEI